MSANKRIVRRYEGWATMTGSEVGWRYYAQLEVKRFGLFGSLVWRDVRGPYYSREALEQHEAELRDRQNLGKQEILP